MFIQGFSVSPEVLYASIKNENGLGMRIVPTPTKGMLYYFPMDFKGFYFSCKLMSLEFNK
jgi:hypothetical protein